jgi:holo-[acyl-carrier protein] synthase
MRVGIDLVKVSCIEESIAKFGERFLQRIFTAPELDYAAGHPEKLACRFAAKEATRKALRLDGVSWRDIEVVRQPDGACEVVYATRRLALSMSHEGDYATAVVIAEHP